MKNQPFAKRFTFASRGIIETLRREKSFRFQVAAACCVLVVLFILRPSAEWWALFLLLISTILSLELVNTALENVIDRLHPEEHESMRLAKDAAAGAVLVLSFTSIAVFLIFLWERLA